MTDDKETEYMERTLQTLKIPDAIKDIPPFNGNKTDLADFIGQVDDILNILKPAFDQKIQAKILLRAIRNKIIGNANDVLVMYNTKIEWPSIKQNLINHFADKRDETSLIRDLHNIAQRNEPVEMYFARILEVVNSLKNWAELNNTTDAAKKSQWYDEMGLAAFITNLKEPLGSIIRSMRPADLPTARLYCLKEQSVIYTKNKIFGQPNASNIRPILPPKANNNFNNFIPQRQLLPRQQTQNYNPLKNQNHYFNHRPFTNQNPNQFGNHRVLPPKPLPRPEPMDTSSIVDKFKQPTFQRPQQFQQRQQYPLNQPYKFNATGPPRFHAKELFNIASNPYNSEFDNYDQEYNYDQYDEESYQYQEVNYEQDTEIPEDNSPIIEIEDSDFHPAIIKNSDT